MQVESSATITASGLTVSGSAPSYQLGANSWQQTITITGSNFETGIQPSNISFGVKSSSISIQSVTASPTQITVIITSVTPTCLTGDTTITITNPIGGGIVSRGDHNYFAIGAMPTITNITLPTYRGIGESILAPIAVNFQVWGNNFFRTG